MLSNDSGKNKNSILHKLECRIKDKTHLEFIMCLYAFYKILAATSLSQIKQQRQHRKWR
jgi:hypothetical protein